MRLLMVVIALAAFAGAAPRAQTGAPNARTLRVGVEAPPSRFDAIVALAEGKMREHRIPGVAIGIVDNGAITTRGLGVTNVEEPLAVTDHTVFPIASISKTFAATVMMRLVEQGKVDLQAPVRNYIPEFKVRDDSVSRDATVWHLLTHSGGWEGQISGPERGEDTLRHFVSTVMSDNRQVAPPTAAELHQRRLQCGRPSDRGGDQDVDQPRDARSRVHAARTRARRHHRGRFHR